MCDSNDLLALALPALLTAAAFGLMLGALGVPYTMRALEMADAALWRRHYEAQALRERRRVRTGGHVYSADREYITVGARVIYNQFNGGLIRVSDAREDKPDDWRVHVVTKLMGPVAFLEPLVPDEPTTA